MTFAESQNLGSAGDARQSGQIGAPKAGAGGRIRLYLGAAAVLALVALAALEDRPVSQDPALQAEPAVTFDGRGKWTGYAR